MPITVIGTPFVDGWNGGSGTFTTGISFDSSLADLILAFVSYIPGSGLTFSDSKSNTPWTQIRDDSAGVPDNRIRSYYTLPSSTGPSHTFSFTGNYCAIGILGLKGVHQTTPIHSTTSGNSGLVSTIQPGSITPPTNGCMWVSGVTEQYLDRTAAPDSPFDSHVYDKHNSNDFALSFAYDLQTTLHARNPTWTMASFPYYVAAQGIVINPADGGSGGGGGTKVPVIMNSYRQRRNYIKRDSGLYIPETFSEFNKKAA